MAYTVMIEDETQATGWSDRFEGSEHNQFENRSDAETAAANLSVVYPGVRWAVFQDDDIEPVYIVNHGDTMHVTDHDQRAIIGEHIHTVLADDSIDWTGYWPVVDPDDLTVTAISDGSDLVVAMLADIVDGRVVIRDGASDVLILRQGDLVLVRSDQGDGGWSLHPAGSTDEQIAHGDAPYLVSGTAQWVDGEWDRPNVQDYAEARTQA